MEDVNEHQKPSSGIASETEQRIEFLANFAKQAKKDITDTVANEKEKVLDSFKLEYAAEQAEHTHEPDR